MSELEEELEKGAEELFESIPVTEDIEKLAQEQVEYYIYKKRKNEDGGHSKMVERLKLQNKGLDILNEHNRPDIDDDYYYFLPEDKVEELPEDLKVYVKHIRSIPIEEKIKNIENSFNKEAENVNNLTEQLLSALAKKSSYESLLFNLIIRSISEKSKEVKVEKEEVTINKQEIKQEIEEKEEDSSIVSSIFSPLTNAVEKVVDTACDTVGVVVGTAAKVVETTADTVSEIVKDTAEEKLNIDLDKK